MMSFAERRARSALCTWWTPQVTTVVPGFHSFPILFSPLSFSSFFARCTARLRRAQPRGDRRRREGGGDLPRRGRSGGAAGLGASSPAASAVLFFFFQISFATFFFLDFFFTNLCSQIFCSPKFLLDFFLLFIHNPFFQNLFPDFFSFSNFFEKLLFSVFL